MRRLGHQPGKQRGMGLILLMATLTLGASWWLVHALSTPVNRSVNEVDANARALAQAKSALLGHLAHEALLATEDHPGRLPCPESPGSQNNHDGTSYLDQDDGVSAGNCALPAVGRLPWRTLGMDRFEDAVGEPLWYVVSPGWTKAFSTDTPAINSNTPGQLMLDGQEVVALIIAPGRSRSVQPCAGNIARNQVRARTPNTPWNRLDFLECENARPSPNTAFTSKGPADAFNDQVIGITAKEIWIHVEGAIAARIKRDVVPQLQAVYATAQWGTTGANPILPFAADFSNFTNASTFAFKGELGRTRGLLPVVSGDCVAGSDPRCDPAFVRWDTSTINVVKRSGTANITGVNCAAAGSPSTPAEIRCRISYERTCGGLGCVLGCPCPATIEVSVLANAPNVGMAMRTIAPGTVTGFSSPVSSVTPIGLTGTATADFRGDLPPDSCTAWLVFGLLIPCTASNTANVSIPIGVFADHPLVRPAPTDPWYWFITNNWHHVTYYAVASSHTPSGATHNCTTAADCLTVAQTTPANNVRAIVVLAGRSLAGAARPNGNLNDFLDSAENRDGDRTYEQKRVDNTFNDRVLSVGNY